MTPPGSISASKFRFGLIERHIDRQLHAPFREIPGSHAVAFRRYDLGRGAGFVQSLARLRKFDLLEAVRDKYSGIQSFQSFKVIFGHDDRLRC
jgi:hypothetical protein